MCRDSLFFGFFAVIFSFPRLLSYWTEIAAQGKKGLMSTGCTHEKIPKLSDSPILGKGLPHV